MYFTSIIMTFYFSMPPKILKSYHFCGIEEWPEKYLDLVFLSWKYVTQPEFSCSKLTMERAKQCVKFFQINNK